MKKEGTGLDNNERRDDGRLLPDAGSQINVTLNRPDADNEMTIDLVQVYYNMKSRTRLFAWVVILCLLIGMCAPLVMYQFNPPMLTVSSVVKLSYDVDDLTAPDGTALDLSQITSSYVLQNALSGLNLSQPLTLDNLKSNIAIERVLTEESRRTQEVAAKMAEDKSQSAYQQAQEVAMTYENRFVVSLTNGFGDPDSRHKLVLKDGELSLVLNRVLQSYNDFLVDTYADQNLPEDAISVIDVDRLDYLESLDLLRKASDDLYDYCDTRPDWMKTYRSSDTGYHLGNLMVLIQDNRRELIDYLYSYLYSNGIARDRSSMITRYEYQLRNTQNDLDTLNEKIATVNSILASYKNDEIFVSMQDSDSTKSTRTPTDYYNRLFDEQMENYQRVASLEIQIADLKDKITTLKTVKSRSSAEKTLEREAEEELQSAVQSTQALYTQVLQQMTELQSSAAFRNYLHYTSAQGKAVSFLSANAKKMVIGALVGLIFALGLWFFAGLAPEIRGERYRVSVKKEADEA